MLSYMSPGQKRTSISDQLDHLKPANQYLQIIVPPDIEELREVNYIFSFARFLELGKAHPHQNFVKTF